MCLENTWTKKRNILILVFRKMKHFRKITRVDISLKNWEYWKCGIHQKQYFCNKPKRVYQSTIRCMTIRVIPKTARHRTTHIYRHVSKMGRHIIINGQAEYHGINLSFCLTLPPGFQNLCLRVSIGTTKSKKPLVKLKPYSLKSMHTAQKTKTLHSNVTIH